MFPHIFSQTGVYYADFLQDVTRTGSPDKRLELAIVMCDILINCCNQLRHAAEYSVTKVAFRDVTKKSFHHIQPRCLNGREVHVEARMLLQPRLHVGMLVCGIVVGDQVQRFIFRCFSVDFRQEF